MGIVMNYTIEADLHSHTVASTHAYSTVHDYVAEAKKKGLKLISITDHGPEMEDAPHAWHFINSAIFPRMVDNIGILRGIEANIRNTMGEIDCNQKMDASLDLILAGFHQQVFKPQDIDTNTLAMVNTIKAGKVHAITHPGNIHFPIHIEEVVKVSAECNVALEINNSSFLHSRKGSEKNCEEVVRLAKQYDAPVSVGSDAHIAYDIGRFDHALALLAKYDFPEARIINHTVSSLFAYLKSKGKDLTQAFQWEE
jgi:putative hydrolase